MPPFSEAFLSTNVYRIFRVFWVASGRQLGAQVGAILGRGAKNGRRGVATPSQEEDRQTVMMLSRDVINRTGRTCC